MSFESVIFGSISGPKESLQLLPLSRAAQGVFSHRKHAGLVTAGWLVAGSTQPTVGIVPPVPRRIFRRRPYTLLGVTVEIPVVTWCHNIVRYVTCTSFTINIFKRLVCFIKNFSISGLSFFFFAASRWRFSG